MAPTFVAVALLLAACLSLSAEGRRASRYEWVEAEGTAYPEGRSLAQHGHDDHAASPSRKPSSRKPSPRTPSPSPASGQLAYEDWEPIRTWCIPDLNASYFCTGSTLESVFYDNQIVPDLLGEDDMGYDVGVKVAFPGRLDVVATFVNKSVAAAAPNVTFSRSAAKIPLLTLIMLDPDASSRWNATNGPILHWLVTNINNSDVTTGEAVQPYRGPGPGVGNGVHRYTLLVLEQTTHAPIHVPLVNQTDPAARRRFDLYKLMDTYKLEAVGGTFFLSAF